jgi:Flp pilus assembly protein TadD
MGLRRLSGTRVRLFGLPALQALAILAIACGWAIATAAYSSNWASDLLLFSRSAKVSPASGIANAQLANQLFKRGQKQAALELYQRAVTDDPQDVRLRLALGMSFMQEGNYRAAEAQLLTSTQLRPAEAMPYFLLGMARAEQGKLADAEESFRRAIALGPQSPRQHFALADVLEREARLPEARDEYQAELALAPAPEARQKLADIERRIGQQTSPAK